MRTGQEWLESEQLLMVDPKGFEDLVNWQKARMTHEDFWDRVLKSEVTCDYIH